MYCDIIFKNNLTKYHTESCKNAVKSDDKPESQVLPEIGVASAAGQVSTPQDESSASTKINLVADYDDEIKLDVKNVESDFVPAEKLKLLGKNNFILNKRIL